MTGDHGDGDSAGQPSTLGLAVVGELSKRGLLGRYFDYSGYRELKRRTTANEVQAFFDAKGFAAVLVKDDPVWIVDGLEEDEADKQPPVVVNFDPWITLVVLPVWLLSRVRKKRRVFPVKKKNKSRYLPTTQR